MIAARVTFGPLSSDPDEREAQIDLADSYLSRLYKNGQIGADWVPALEQGRRTVYVSLARPDAYKEEYNSTWNFLRREYDNMVGMFGQEPEWTVLDDTPEAFAKADWQGAPSLVLYTLWADEDALLARGDTGDEVAIYLLPTSDLKREHLVGWGAVFREHELIWLDSADLEIPAYKQIVEPDSTLMTEGRDLARAIETATGSPTYVYLPRYWGRRQGEEQGACPSCGNPWYVGGTPDGEYLNRFAFRCDDCRLVSDMPSDTSDERHARLGEYRPPHAAPEASGEPDGARDVPRSPLPLPPMPEQPPRQNRDDIDDTIDPTDEVDEALLETFPASDAPGYTGGAAMPDARGSYTAADAERARNQAKDTPDNDA